MEAAREIVRDQLVASLLYNELQTVSKIADELSNDATITRAHLRNRKHAAALEALAKVYAGIDALAEWRRKSKDAEA